MKADSVRLSRTKEGETIRKEVKNNKVHKVLHCRNSVGVEPVLARCGATWNRDVNASKNILFLLELWIMGDERPPMFSRTSKTYSFRRGAAVPVPASVQVAEDGPTVSLSCGPDEQSSEI
jgi:hypothetical protein